jgi:hypothetical protein
MTPNSVIEEVARQFLAGKHDGYEKVVVTCRAEQTEAIVSGLQALGFDATFRSPGAVLILKTLNQKVPHV